MRSNGSPGSASSGRGIFRRRHINCKFCIAVMLFRRVTWKIFSLVEESEILTASRAKMSTGITASRLSSAPEIRSAGIWIFWRSKRRCAR